MLPENTKHNIYAYLQHLPLLSIEKITLWYNPSQAQAPTRADETKGISQQ